MDLFFKFVGNVKLRCRPYFCQKSKGMVRYFCLTVARVDSPRGVAKLNIINDRSRKIIKANSTMNRLADRPSL